MRSSPQGLRAAALLCNNGLRLGSSAPYASHPNRITPGKEALLGNGPTIILDKGRFKMAFGSPGGETIGQTQFHLIDRDMPIQTAIEAPRFAVEADPSFYKPGAAITVQMEGRNPDTMIGALGGMGHRIERAGPYPCDRQHPGDIGRSVGRAHGQIGPATHGLWRRLLRSCLK